MPDKKKDWKCWNVEMSSGRQEPQLTFWLNEFYPDARFDKDIFQTWAPVAPPKKDTIITRCDFERVVHSSEARAYIDDINKEQGKGSIYYAGSYCVYGMGVSSSIPYIVVSSMYKNPYIYCSSCSCLSKP